MRGKIFRMKIKACEMPENEGILKPENQKPETGNRKSEICVGTFH